jgi:preprotein translocase subunit SecF
MQFLTNITQINFMKMRPAAVVFSGLLILVSIISFVSQGINWGLDFTGGTKVSVVYAQDADAQLIRDTLAKQGSGFEKAVVQFMGSSKEIAIRLPPIKDIDNSKIADKVVEILSADGTELYKDSSDFISPTVGEELTEQGGIAMIIALICIMIYVSIRFEWKFALGSVAALTHDVLITIGFFSVTQLEFNLTIVAAVLAVIGYSLNDTIVVFDRIRENFLNMRQAEPIDVTNTSLNQTLARTLMTSLTTLFVLLALFFVGGQMIHGFATALIIGVLIGTYSSIYVASTSVIALGISKEDLMPVIVEKEGDDTEANHPYTDI